VDDLQLMSPKKEAEVERAMREAIVLASKGTDPSEAVAKVASDHGFEPGVAQRMVEAFNQSKTLHLYKDATFDRTSIFEIADAAKVLKIMYPDDIRSAGEEKAASSMPACYALPEHDEFIAAIGLPEPLPAKRARLSGKDIELLIKRAADRHTADLRAVDAAKTEEGIRKNALMRQLQSIAGYFTRQMNPRPFADVETDAVTTLGPRAKMAMDLVWNMCPDSWTCTQKRGSEVEREIIIDDTRTPLPQIREAVRIAGRCNEAGQLVERLSKESTEFWSEFQNKRAELNRVRKGGDEDDLSEFFREGQQTDLAKHAARS